MTNIYFYSMLVTAIALFSLAIHIVSDRTLIKHSKRGFALAACFLGMSAVCEGMTCGIIPLNQAPAFFAAAILLQLIITPFVCALQYYACDMPEWGKRLLIPCIVYGALAVILYFATDSFFTITPDGEYVTGQLMLITAAVSAFMIVADVIMLRIISRKYKKEKILSIVLIGILLVISCVSDFFGGLYAAGIISDAFAFYLLYSFYTSIRSRAMTEQIAKDGEMFEQLSVQTMKALADAIDAKDQYTNGHSRRVSQYSVMLARELGWNEEQLKMIKFAGLIHDIGKIGIPDSVLNKPGRLSATERSMMNTHTVFGSEIASEITTVPEAYHAARSHHERYDGKGYPNGLAGEDIPEIARIIAVADTFDAMNSDRIYRRALSRQIITDEMMKGSGTQFDPKFVKVFMDLYNSGKLDKIAAEGRRDMIPQEELDRFASLVADVFEFFQVSYEFAGEWQEKFSQWGRLNRYIRNMYEDAIDYDMVVISITAAQGRSVEEKHLEDAFRVMIDCVNSFTDSADVCARISKTQIAAVFQKESDLDISSTVQHILLYFYKIFESGALAIEYRIIDSDEDDEKEAAANAQ